MIVETFPLQEIPTWNKMLQDFPEQATVFHTAEWMNTLQLAFGHEPRVLLALGEDEGSYFAGLPYMVDKRFGINNYLSMPLDTYGGAIGKAEYTNGLEHYFLTMEGIGVRWCVGYHKPGNVSTECIGLTSDVWNALHKGNRRAINAAQKNGVIIRTSDKHISLYDRVQKSLARSITNIMIPAGLCKQFVALADGEIVAASLFFQYGTETMYWAGTTTERGRKTNANHLLMWEAIKDAKQSGCTIMNLGASPDNANTLMQYKKAWGTTTHLYSKRMIVPTLMKPILKIKAMIS